MEPSAHEAGRLALPCVQETGCGTYAGTMVRGHPNTPRSARKSAVRVSRVDTAEQIDGCRRQSTDRCRAEQRGGIGRRGTEPDEHHVRRRGEFGQIAVEGGGISTGGGEGEGSRERGAVFVAYRRGKCAGNTVVDRQGRNSSGRFPRTIPACRRSLHVASPPKVDSPPLRLKPESTRLSREKRQPGPFLRCERQGWRSCQPH